MNNNIYLHTVNTIFRPAVNTASVGLDEIIAVIRSTKHQDTIERVRRAPTKAEKDKIKADELPAFFPSTTLDADGKVQAATGVIQFDVDVSKNAGLDFGALKREVSRHPACLYAFFSPDRGLKFGILTDFARSEGEDADAMIERFKDAYKLCLAEVEATVTTRFAVDRATNHIRQSCFFSHDPNAIYRPDCDTIILNARCEYRPAVHATTDHADLAEIELALAEIPRTLGYDERLPVNRCVLGMVGQAGIPILKAHWQTDDPQKLDRQLQAQLKGARFGTVAHLWAVARQHGYKPPIGKQRWTVKPEPCDIALEPLSTPEEATEKLRDIVRLFVDSKQSQFVNVSAGAGKTETVLKTIIEYVSDDTKVLILVPTHKLGNEIVQRFKQLREQRVQNATSLKDKVRIKRVIPIVGRDLACENQEQWKLFKDKNVSMPWVFCSHHCGMRGDCYYTQQFDDPLSNIRVMTHDEWRNEQSAWFSGRRSVNDGYEPRRGRNAWVPDLIVIDEDVIKVDEIMSEAASTSFPSLGLVIESVKKGMSLRDAVWSHCDQVLTDSRANIRVPSPPFTNTTDYVKAVARNRKTESYSPILDRLAKYCRYDEPKYLNGVWVENDSLHLVPVRLAAKRYANVPTLYLDATASEAVVRTLLPDVSFHRISVKQKDDIRVFQLSNKTLTREFLDDPTNVQTVITGLKPIVSRYENVGLITYKNTDSDPAFYQTLSNALGVNHTGYFKHLRGLNEFENVDCLLIVGRFRLPSSASKNLVRAIFGEDSSSMPQNANLPVRMKNGSTFTLNSYVAENDFHQAIHEHFSLSETLQAIGRGRLIHGQKKDIYVLSSENLTTNIEITDFFSYEGYFGERETANKKSTASLLATETLDRVLEKGYLQDIESELVSSLNLKASQVKRNRDKIRDELAAVGLIRQHVTIRYRNGTTGPRNYLVSDRQKLELALKEKSERVTEWHTVGSDDYPVQ
ncbi:hypothetical protein J2801_001648 [Paraburkholderia phenoliruptrix]|uniref:BT4734/BF3469 family protein n=1 Tax=Paraburkholderia phenoliruptrix TaxID=252970 RepID=UPI00285437EE|nr:BT4734/BF3469 family protein [Paraburkholderia phenoliruptrix]MDR6419397.1 hypothetical protein [Paraburkholderia phenoliruptrix]